MQESTQSEFDVVCSEADAAAAEHPADRKLFVIEGSVGYVVNFTARLLARSMAASLAQHDVTLAQWVILQFLMAGEGQTQAQLSRHVVIDDATMVRTIDRMERDGLVQRVRNPHDRREYNIFLTDKSRALRDVLISAAVAVNTAAVQQLTEAEQQQLLSLLRRVITSLEPAAPIKDKA